MNKYSLSTMAAVGLLAGGLSVSSASAADLGGNCCADLEERIAELEATTARKGNRKVSLTVSGWVNQQITFWDNGEEPVGPALYNFLGTPLDDAVRGVQVLQSYWFIKSDQLGKVSVGQQSQASDNTAILVDGSGSLVPANWVAFDVNSFRISNVGVAPN